MKIETKTFINISNENNNIKKIKKKFIGNSMKYPKGISTYNFKRN